MAGTLLVGIAAFHSWGCPKILSQRLLAAAACVCIVSNVMIA
jgi:hypothetical protein